MTDRPPNLSDHIPAVTARPLGAPPLVPLPSDLELPYLPRRDALLDLTLVLLVAIVLPYLPMVVAPFMEEQVGLGKVDLLVVFKTWCQAGVCLSLMYYMVRRHKLRPTSFGLQLDKVGMQFLWSLGALSATYAVLLASVAVVMIAYKFDQTILEKFEERREFIDSLPAGNLGITLMLVTAVAINEELIFRGLLLPYFRRLLGSWTWAVLISSVIFAIPHIPHQGLLGGLQILPVGIVLSLFFILSRSLLAVIIAHLLFNFTQFQLIRFLPDLEKFVQDLQG